VLRVILNVAIGGALAAAAIFGIITHGSFKGRLYSSSSKQDLSVLRAIVQTGPVKEAVKTTYLAELLDLCIDHPTLTSEIDLRRAEKRLRASPVIVDAEVKIQDPGILYIDYTTRKPIALLYDYENMALDNEGCPFPIAPFYSPKKLPQVYLGLRDSIRWNTPISGEKMELVFSLLEVLNGPIVCDLFDIKRIDVSKAFERSLGSEEIVVMTQDRIYSAFQDREVSYIFPRILRLSKKNYAQELGDYLKLRETLLEKERKNLRQPIDKERIIFYPQKIIDLRVPQLAVINESEGAQ